MSDTPLTDAIVEFVRGLPGASYVPDDVADLIEAKFGSDEARAAADDRLAGFVDDLPAN